MTDADRKRFGEIILGLCETFGRDFTEGLLEGYWLGLHDLSLDEVAEGVAFCLCSSTFMPKPVEIREVVDGRPDERTVAAWEALVSAIRRHGAYASVDFEDRAINATIRALGGWERICGMEREELQKWWRKDFDRTYLALSNRALSPEAAAHLPGLHELNNTAISRGKFEIVSVGDRPALAKTKQIDAPVSEGRET